MLTSPLEEICMEDDGATGDWKIVDFLFRVLFSFQIFDVLDRSGRVHLGWLRALQVLV